MLGSDKMFVSLKASLFVDPAGASIRILIWAATWQNQWNECVPSKDSDQPGHPPSLIRVLAVRMKKAWVFSYPLSAQRRLWSDWADAQADLSLLRAHSHFVGFVMSRLIFIWHALGFNENDHTTKKKWAKFCEPRLNVPSNWYSGGCRFDPWSGHISLVEISW